MPTAIVMKGLSGSGKSTQASRYKDKGYLVFNRDTARLENPTLKEKDIILLEDKFIVDNIGNDIVIDNTHMNSKSRFILYEKLRESGYEIFTHDMIEHFNNQYEYLQVSIERNNLREGISKVPNSVIYQQYLQEYKIYDKIIICDIDGTIANLDHRLHYIKQDKKDHDSFYNEVINDTPIPETISIVRSMHERGYKIVLMSGRRNQTCEDTEKWLHSHNVPYDFLLMRSGWDKRQDYEVKEELYEKCLRKQDIFFAIDDRKQIVDLRKRIGIFVFDVRQTDEIF